VTLTWIIFALWTILVLSAMAFFHFSKDVTLKRRAFPAFLGVAVILFLAFAAEGMIRKGRFHVWPFMAIAVVAMAYVSLRTVRFCDRCSTLAPPRYYFRPQAVCPKCSAKLK